MFAKVFRQMNKLHIKTEVQCERKNQKIRRRNI